MSVGVAVKNKQMIPCVFNVKQWTSGVDTFVFAVDRYAGDVDLAALTCRIVCDKFDIELEASADDDTVTAVWMLGYNETYYKGTYTVQLVFANDDESVVWRSYNAVLIVSVSSETTDPTELDLSGGDCCIVAECYGVTAEAVVDDDEIVGTFEVAEDDEE